jgi:hypothetical protein
MSTVNLSDLMRELQAGEEARAKVPALQAQADDLTRKLDDAQRHAQGLEANIFEYKRTIDGLNAKVRSLEVERDDAGFRELEAQERIATMLNALRGFRHDIDETVDKVDPPKPAEPAQQPVSNAGVPAPNVNPSQNIPITDHGLNQSQGERVPDPTPSANAPATNESSSGTAQSPTVGAPDNAAPSGQSDSNPPSAPSTVPTPSNASGAGVEPSNTAPSMTEAYRPFEGQSAGDAGPKADTGPRKTEDYEPGKRWYQKPDTMSTADWIASGGQP